MQFSSCRRCPTATRRRTAAPSLSALIAATFAAASFSAHADIMTAGVPVNTPASTSTLGPGGNRIYAAGNPAKVIDAATNVAQSLGICASSFVVNKTLQRVYGTPCTTVDGVSVINDATQSVIATIPNTPGGAFVIDEAANRLYGLRHEPFASPNALVVVDGNTNTSTTIDFTGTFSDPTSIDLLKSSGKIYVTNFTTNNLTIISTSTLSASNFPLPSDAAVVRANDATGKAYVVRGSANAVTVVDGATNAQTHVAVASTPTDVAFNPVTNNAYVTSGATSTVTVINAVTNIATSVPAVVSSGLMAFNPTTNKVYIGGTYAVAAIDGTTHASTTVSTFFPLPTDPFVASISALGVNPATNRIYAVITSLRPRPIAGTTA